MKGDEACPLFKVIFRFLSFCLVSRGRAFVACATQRGLWNGVFMQEMLSLLPPPFGCFVLSPSSSSPGRQYMTRIILLPTTKRTLAGLALNIHIYIEFMLGCALLPSRRSFHRSILFNRLNIHILFMLNLIFKEEYF